MSVKEIGLLCVKPIRHIRCISTPRSGILYVCQLPSLAYEHLWQYWVVGEPVTAVARLIVNLRWDILRVRAGGDAMVNELLCAVWGRGVTVSELAEGDVVEDEVEGDVQAFEECNVLIWISYSEGGTALAWVLGWGRVYGGYNLITLVEN